jgi:O-antigen/teichoic acid export membrane protein
MKLSFILTKINIKNSLLKSSIIVLIASTLTNFLSYIFQLISGRYFSLEDYANLVTLFSLISILSPVLLSPIVSGVPKLVAEIKDEDYPNKISILFFSVLRLTLTISFLLTVIFIIILPFLSDYLNINNKPLLYSFLIFMFFSLAFGYLHPFLQGLLRFKAYSFISIIQSVLKLSVIVIVILLNLSLRDTFVGLSLSVIVGIIVTFFVLKKNIRFNKAKMFNSKDIRTLILYSTGGSLGFLGMHLLMNIDVLLVKHFFSAQEAGIYSSVAIMGRIAYYSSFPVIIVMVPMIAERFKKGLNYNRIFMYSMISAISITAIITIIFSFFPSFIVKVLFGIENTEISDLLSIFGIFMILYTILSVIVSFLISISRFKLAAVSIASATLQFTLINLFHSNLKSVILLSSLACVIGIFIMIAGILKPKLPRIL